ncbi:MAG: type I methionyl aminopeptidase [Deltaproteobacteria bacterium]|nr:type I methionyl aminopeptidase [Deltaproteobacteria bacterium]
MKLKSDKEIQLIRQAGLLLWETHQVAAEMVEAGVTTHDINQAVEEFIQFNKAEPLFKGVPGTVPFPAATCISVNEEIVHGIPSKRQLKNGDIVSLDIGIRLNGWCADAAVTYPVGEIDAEKQKLLQITEECLRKAIELLGENSRWKFIGKKIQKVAEHAGFSVVRELVGHGIGRSLWEKPQVPNYFSEQVSDFRIKPGLVIAIEPMINVGTKEIETLSDHWTIVTRDRKPSAHFEHTIAMTKSGPMVLTCGPNGEGWAMGNGKKG